MTPWAKSLAPVVLDDTLLVHGGMGSEGTAFYTKDSNMSEGVDKTILRCIFGIGKQKPN